MSPSGRAEGMARLRRAVAEIEAEAGPADVRGERAARRLPLGRALDSALGGGLADDGLHEIAPAEPQDGAAAMGFALALAARFLDRRPASALIIGEGFAAQEAGALYGPGLIAHGLPLSRLVFVHAPDAAWPSGRWRRRSNAARRPRSWARSGTSRAIASPPRAACCSPRAKGGRPRCSFWPAPMARRSASPAPPRPGSKSPPRRAPGSRRRPAGTCPGPFACGARLVKARLARAGPEGPLRAFDAERVIRLEWRSQDNHFEELAFGDPAISLPVAAAAGDRPRAAS